MRRKISRLRQGLTPLMALALLAPVLVPMSGCAPLLVGAAATTGVVVATDRRKTGAQLDDTTTSTAIAYKVNAQYGERVRVSVTSYNGIILLTGEVPDQTIWDGVAQIAAKEERVRAVENELLIGSLSSLSSRANDSYITSKVKARFVDSQFSPTHVKVVTERGTVYLMGLVKRAEGAQAADIARKTSGVKRVVLIFEYTDENP
ncbi:MAG: BON domain-containing protein [Burkholderiales bacterium]|jgi:osmotically-inducible protein OsmY|nr:BON domain-containing protein [Burkholderiales bacterium]